MTAMFAWNEIAPLLVPVLRSVEEDAGLTEAFVSRFLTVDIAVFVAKREVMEGGDFFFFTYITHEDILGWGIDSDQLFETSYRNLRRIDLGVAAQRSSAIRTSCLHSPPWATS